MTTKLGDPGKLMPAGYPGNCEECGGTIVVGQIIYFSRLHGSRHKQCVEPGEPGDPAPAADRERAPRAAPPSDAAPRDAWLWADGSAAPPPPRDDEPRAPARGAAGGPAGERDGARSVGDQIRQQAGREQAKRDVVEAFEALAASLRRLLLG